MTPAESLRAAADAEDEGAVRALLADLSEADRAELIPIAREVMAAQLKKGIGAAGHLAPTILMAYGTLTLSEIRRLGWRASHLPRDLVDVLRHRSPERLVPIVDFLLDDIGGHGAWRVVRPLIRDGIVARPDRPSYTLAMLMGTNYTSAAQVMAEDPGLLEVEAWRLFEVEGGGDNSLANHEKFSGDPWGKVFRDLAARDPIQRERLLDLSLAALARDFATYRAGWFSRFHESLVPTDEERAMRADAYLSLLRSRVGPTVSMAVAALARIQRAGRLSSTALLDAIGPVLAEGSAGTAKTGLDLVARAGAGDPENGRTAAIVAAQALGNASADVQRAAIGLIERLAGEPDEALARAVDDRLPDVAASQRTAAAALATRLGGDAAAHVAAAAAPKGAVDGAVPPSTRRPSATEPARAMEPLTSIESLVDVAVSVLEAGEPADDLERVLDAVGRLGADRPAGFQRLTGALARRARTILDQPERRAFTGFDARADIAAVLLAWTTGELVERQATLRAIDPGAGAFLSARARELSNAIANGGSFVSVAAPTHSGGWIDPAVLVRRLRVRPPASTLDLVAALLRLAPAGRAEALGAATGLAGETGAAVRYALGGDERIGPTAAPWVAAARVRAPGDDDASVEKRHPGLGPDAGLAARIRLSVSRPRPSFGGIRLDVQPQPVDDVGVDLPTVLMLRDPSSFAWTGHSEPSMFRWIATIQPGYREVWAAIGTLLIGRNIDWWSAEWANRVFLEPFIDPVTPIGPHARVLIGVALGAREAGERGLATDVVGLALLDGRLTAPDLAEGLGVAAAGEFDRPNRWAVSLAGVAMQSDGHAAAVAEAIARSLPALGERPAAKLVPLLRLFDELLAGTGNAPAEDGRQPLERLAGSGGQAGRLARSILSRGPVGTVPDGARL
ncbi:MAG: hypothetical protein QOJ75_2159 [Chloroflexota bacterium]|nr:hypothetical protein [Chloroflexota bacterium]